MLSTFHARVTTRLLAVFAMVANLACSGTDAGSDESVEGDEEGLGSPPANAQFSDLWGQFGGKWSPTGRLPDFSYAGYHGGDEEIPKWSAKVDITDFGAKSGDDKDDTDAIEAAIAAAPKHGVVFVPKGKWKVNRPIRIHRSRVVIRGEGSGDGGSVLLLPRPLLDAAPGEYDAKEVSYSGGFIEVIGKGPEQTVAKITARTDRGGHWLDVDDTSKLAPGDIVAVRLKVDGDFFQHVYAGQYKLSNPDLSDTFDMPVVVDKVEPKRVRLLQPLRIDVRKDWDPKIVRQSLATEVGIEKLQFDFEKKPYPGHHHEKGYNGIHMIRVANCWVRSVRFENADNGVKVERGKWVTVEDASFGGRMGHHAVSVAKSADVLVQGLHFDNEWWHELTVVYGAHGTVFRDVSASSDVTVNLDHHGGFPFENLFTNFHSVEHYSWLSGGGSPAKGPHTGARGTFWNLPGLSPPHDYDDSDGDPDGEMELLPWGSLQTNLVGKLSGTGTQKTAKGRWYEDLPKLWPPDIYRAQLDRRLKGN
jgi:hypothetical protein